jgi:hypothetical protein
MDSSRTFGEEETPMILTRETFMKMLLLVCLLFVAGCQFSAKIDNDSFSMYFKRNAIEEPHE